MNLSLMAEQSIDEYNMKTVLLYQIMRFVEWPESVVDTESEQWQVCLIGEDYFENTLDKLANKKIIGRNIVVTRDIKLQQVEDCQLLFINVSMQKQLPQLLKNIHDLPILTIADTPDFIQQGVMFNLIFDDDHEHIIIEINPLLAEKLGFNIHSRLLNLAHLIEIP